MFDSEEFKFPPPSEESIARLLQRALGLPGGFEKVAQVIVNSPDPQATMKRCFEFVDLQEAILKEDVNKAQAAVDKFDARLLKAEISKVVDQLKSK